LPEGGTLGELVRRARETYNEAEEALQSGDWAGYGEALKRLEGYLQRLDDLTRPLQEEEIGDEYNLID
jgi:hypothetical protein